MGIKDTKVISIRRERNSDLIRRMKNGESLTSYDSSSSWFPPRPTIEKDKDAITKLYGKASRRRKNAVVEVKEEISEPNLVVLPVAQ